MTSTAALPEPRAEADLAALIGSRICHDLISPLGAIGNGLELLAMAGAVSGPEMELIAESVANANARVRFFRIAFGASDAGQMVRRGEILSVLADMARGGRVACAWDIAGDAPRARVKAAFLALLCLETALPHGGRVVVSASGDDWHAVGRGPRIAVDAPLWSTLAGGAGADISPARVQFALLPAEIAAQGRRIAWRESGDSVEMTF